ncbi:MULTISPECIES: response regulator [Methylobacterium]|jgi:DNA-binding NarL/FixJ family response regulator|uniref:Oxygen regulatory protein NreC n=1 Tax=Methylobacterium isbiliense TaxID=315478 RepID=A0ABQ4SJI0_9HYPH|nr:MULTISPECIES: response regulator transcription factor [Methylobacterium]MBY0298119.1 response regulator transcription factor [Methylobacterium sp.]MDN3625909.1 response regulator transcription factor [Methylobacterium isbiliense]GJE02578.1 Oxygen regulatory protein NreC [Methylobacterium isbiliense]
MPVTILIVDDHGAIRRGVRAILEAHDGVEVVAEAATGAEAIDLAAAHKPTVAVIDYALPVMNGSQLTRRIREASPKTQVLVFTMHESEALVRDVLAAGARGYLLKSDADQQLVAAVDALSRHQTYFTSRVNEALLAHYLAHPGQPSDMDVLTAREREVVQLIAEGQSSKQASETLAISLKTVETHRAAAMHKLGLSTTAALVRYAVRNKLVEP